MSTGPPAPSPLDPFLAPGFLNLSSRRLRAMPDGRVAVSGPFRAFP